MPSNNTDVNGTRFDANLYNNKKIKKNKQIEIYDIYIYSGSELSQYSNKLYCLASKPK